jgi:uncharacterized membrane protein YkoI
MPMMRKLLPLVASLALAAAALAPGIAQASGRDDSRKQDRGRDQDDDRERGRDDDDRGSGRRISLDEAMAQAERRYKARAVHGEERRQGDRIVYRIRLLDQDGRVFEISVDAGSGRDK